MQSLHVGVPFWFQNFWEDNLQNQFRRLVYVKDYFASVSDVQVVRERLKRDQFLIKLHHEFEVARSNLMNHDPSPSLDICFRELLYKEKRLFTQTMFQQDSISNSVAYAAHRKRKDMLKV